MPDPRRYRDVAELLAGAAGRTELARSPGQAAAGSPHLVPKLVAQGWPLLADVAPVAAAVVIR